MLLWRDPRCGRRCGRSRHYVKSAGPIRAVAQISQKKHALEIAELKKQQRQTITTLEQDRKQLNLLRNEIADYRATMKQVTGQLHAELRQLGQQLSQPSGLLQVALED